MVRRLWMLFGQGSAAMKHCSAVMVGGSVLIALVLAACGAATDDTDVEPEQATSAAPRQSLPAAQPTQAHLITQIAVPAPTEAPAEPAAQAANIVYDFQIDDVYTGADKLGGETVAFSSLFDGDKPIILNFWAGLCPPCRAEMPDFQEAYEEFGNDVLLLGLDVGPFVGLGTIQQGRDLVDELNVSYPTGTTEDANVVRAYQLFSMPSTIFMKPNGEVVTGWPGPLTKSKLVELTQELLEKSGR